MVRPSLTAMSIAVLLLSSTAFADKNKSQDFYLRIESGFSFPSSLKSDGKIGINEGIDVAYYNNKAPKGSIIYGAVLGYRFSDHFRTDFNISGRNYSFNAPLDVKLAGDLSSKINASQKISAVMMMLNGYYDIGQYGIVTPYITAGIGASFNKTDDYKFKYDLTRPDQLQIVNEVLIKGKSNMSLAWNVGAGISIACSTNASIDIGYRFINFGGITTKENQTIEGYMMKNGQKTPNPQKTVTAPAIKSSLKAHEVSIGFTYKF